MLVVSGTLLGNYFVHTTDKTCHITQEVVHYAVSYMNSIITAKVTTTSMSEVNNISTN
jgi:hypothetical protein